MKRRSILKTMAVLPIAQPVYGANGTRTWLGPQYWPNPLQDWRRSGERIECHVSGGDRNVFWLTKEIAPDARNFNMSVRLGRLGTPARLKGAQGWVGFRTGMRGFFRDYRDTAIRGLGMECGVTDDGRLFIITPEQNAPVVSSLDDVTLTLSATGTRFRLRAGDRLIEKDVPSEWVGGGVALVCHSGRLPSGLPLIGEPEGANSGKPPQLRGGAMTFWFRKWELDGPGIVSRPERAWGPILFTQYTVSHGVLKMTAQLAPLEGDEGAAELQLQGRKPVRGQVDPYSSTALFRVEGWDSLRDVPYTVVFAGHKYTGSIARDPKDKNEIVVGSLTCQGDFGFPHAEIARNLAAARPDILFFTGDQLYEANGGYGIQRGPREAARLDYLRKWYMFGWAWGDLTRNTPTICLPDDHDVYHGNLWGAAGKQAQYPEGPEDMPARQQGGQDSGGYTMPAPWVNMVQRTQSSHLPDSPYKGTVLQSITVHFCEMNWGGIGFAILEDRKWKSAPKQLLPDADIRNGWPQNPEWDSAKRGDVPGAQLLGQQQEEFLKRWARDWPEGVDMKAVVSQTIFCNLCTLPPGMTSDAGTPKLPVPLAGGYMEGEHLAQDHDSNGWPQTPRNRALRAIRSCLAVHLAGDQHLPSTIQYGIDEFNDASWVICSPAISNIFPRRWYPAEPAGNRKPGAPRYTGEYLDGFGNRITVHAVANPQKFDARPRALHERVPGFGLVRFYRRERRIQLESYPRWASIAVGTAGMFQGWPITIHQTDNGLNGARYEIRLPSGASGLVRVTQSASEQPVLMWRTAEAIDRISVWQPGKYDVQIGSVRFFGLEAGAKKT